MPLVFVDSSSLFRHRCIPFSPCLGKPLGVLLLLLAGDVEINPGPQSSSTALRIGTLNVRSANTKSALINDFITTERLDLLIATETWFNESSVYTDLLPVEYGIHLANRIAGRGGGIAVIYHEPLRIQPEPKITHYQSFEYTSVLLLSCKPIIRILGVYRPPTAANHATFINEFTSLLEHYNEQSHSTCLLGDFNIHAQDNSDTFTQSFVSLLNSFSLTQHVTQPTHIKGNTLDLVITPLSLSNNVAVSLCDYNISDHTAVIACITVPSFQQSKRPAHTYRPIGKIDIESFCSDLKQTVMFSMPSEDVNIFASQIEQSFSVILDVHAPLRTTNRAPRSERWQDDHIDELKSRRRFFERRFLRSKSCVYKRLHRLACKTANAAINQKHREHYASMLNVCSSATGNNKIAWKTVSKLLTGSQNRLDADLASHHTLSQDLQQFFIDKVENISLDISRLVQSPASGHCLYDQCCFTHQLNSFIPVTAAEVKHAIINSPMKSSGSDFIPTSLLLKCIDTVIDPITRLFNMSLKTGVFPDTFKSARITPVLKKSGADPQLFSNYRPISNLNFLGKVLERIVLQQLNKHLDTEPNFNIYQSGFKVCHSTETALTKITSDILTAMDKKFVTILTLLDFSAAFDTITHKVLIDRLCALCNIQSFALNWFNSYLGGRTQSVYMGQMHSDSKPVTRGVPQGSVLGPVLFTIYTAPIQNIISLHGLTGHFYADDTQLYISCKPEDVLTAKIKLEACLKDIVNWLLHNNLALNANKSELLVFGTKQQLGKLKELPKIQVNGVTLTASQSAKDLGVWLDPSLTYDKHIGMICKSCYFYIRKLSHIRRYLSQKSSAAIAAALVASRLDYCNNLLYGTTASNISRLQKIQNSLARVVCRLPYKSQVTPALRKLHWLPVKQRIEYKVALLSFMALHESKPTYLANSIALRQPAAYALRNHAKLDIPHGIRSCSGERAFTAAAPHIWNSLPINVITAASLSIFKSRLKTHLFNTVYNNY
jgi:exonuclease III